MRRFFGPTGSVNRITIDSRALEKNLLGDPSARVVDIYLPAGHDGEGLPLLVDLVGFTGSGLSHTNWLGFRENLPERLDRLIGEQKMPGRRRLSRLLYSARRQSIHQFAGDGCVGGLFAARDAACGRTALPLRRRRAPRCVW